MEVGSERKKRAKSGVRSAAQEINDRPSEINSAQNSNGTQQNVDDPQHLSGDQALNIRRIVTSAPASTLLNVTPDLSQETQQRLNMSNSSPDEASQPVSQQECNNNNSESAATDLEYMQKKCLGATNRRQRSVSSMRESPLLKRIDRIRPHSDRHVFLHQNRPSPMAPLKAWKGYNGNIYFNPIKINRVSSAAGAIESVGNSQGACNTEITSAREKQQHRRQQTARPLLNRMSFHCDLPPRQFIVMDKEHVLRQNNIDIEEDLEWIRDTENVGSLKMERGAGDVRARQKRFDRSLVHKGSVAHSLAKQRRSSTALPHETGSRNNRLMGVCGDKLSSDLHTYSTNANALIRTTTQYSQSRHRESGGRTAKTIKAHKSDNLTEALNILPPLEQLRAG